MVLGSFAGLAPGPYTTMVVGTALEKGFKAGALLALSPLVTDIVPMLFSALLLGKLGGLALTLLGIGGGAIILMVGIRFLRGSSGDTEVPVAGVDPDRPLTNGGRQSARLGHVVATTLLNPAPWLFWFIVASPLLLRSWHRGPGEGILFIVILFLTNITTATALAWIASHSRRLLNPDWYRRALQGVGITLILAGSFLCWQATTGNFQAVIERQEAIKAVVEDGISNR
jgi:threonine/homoserine/homoserine lactone efflux protein